jgi:hypothetical protein
MNSLKPRAARFSPCVGRWTTACFRRLRVRGATLALGIT